jgi:hypothetical protein
VVQLIEVESGEVHELHESLDEQAFLVQFEAPGVWFRAGEEWMAFDLNGKPVPGGEGPEFPFNACREGPAGEVCGVISPDARWLLFWKEAGKITRPNGFVVDVTDQWVLDVEAGAERLLVEGLVSCGGCDGVFGPRWSASSNYVVFTESGGDGRRWLTNLQTGATTPIGNGQGVGTAPVWAPTTDRVLYSTAEGGTVLHTAETGTTTELAVAWPAAFDSSGAYAYSPAWHFHVSDDKDPNAPEPETTVVELASRSVVYVLAGAAPYANLWDNADAVGETPQGLLAVLQGADGCDGTAIYLDGELDRCVEGGREARIGPGGLIAVARDTGPLGNIQWPNGGALESREFAIDIVHPDGTLETVVEGAYGLDAAPGMTWNDAGTHLLVQWPRFTGL